MARSRGKQLSDLLVAANREILAQGDRIPSFRGMGTTIVAATIVGTPEPVAHIAHLGDSRAYLFREGRVRQLTRDHTLVEEFIQAGAIDVHEAKVHPKRHVLTRALGLEPDTQPERTSTVLRHDDLLLLCSDGLTKMMTDEDIATVLSRCEGDPSRSCDAIVDTALERGGEDNITVIVCAETSVPPHPDVDKHSSPM